MAQSPAFLIVDSQSRSAFFEKVFPESPACRVDVAPALPDARRKLTGDRYTALWVNLDLLKEGTAALQECMEFCEFLPVVLYCEDPASRLHGITLNENIFAVLPAPLCRETVFPVAVQLQRTSVLLHGLYGDSGSSGDSILRDADTGLYNDRYLKERLRAEFKRASRYFFSLSLVFAELVFDGSGNVEKQKTCVRAFARFLLHFARGNDIVVYEEGARFLIVLPDTGKKGALVFARRLLESVRSSSFDSGGDSASCDASIGIASFPEDGVKQETGLLDLAERALHKARGMEGRGVYSFRSISDGNLREFFFGRGHGKGKQ